MHFYRLIGATCIALACTVASSALAQSAADLKPLEANDTDLGKLAEDDNGMYSGSWAVRDIPGPGDSNTHYMDLNGDRLGPFDRTGSLISFSQDGTQVVFAGKEAGSERWSVYRNGSKMGDYEGLAWGTYSWPLGLEKNKIRMQTKSVAFSQSPDNELVSFFTYRKQGENTTWANVTNGKAGRYYSGINTNVSFVDGRPAYWAWKTDDQKFLVIGEEEFGPYASARSLKISEDGNHYGIAAQRGADHLLLRDGTEGKMPGEILAFTIANSGRYAVAYRDGQEVRVSVDGVLWPDKYLDVVWHQLRATPDGTTVAGWFKREDGWYVVINGERSYGPYDSYYFIEAGDYYSLFLGRNGHNVVYFSRHREGRSTGKTIYINGSKADTPLDFPGISITYYPDDSGGIVGAGLMGAIDVDTQAVADAVALGAANPLKARYAGDSLIRTKQSGESTFVAEGVVERGPYSGVGAIFSSPLNSHFGYTVSTAEGESIIVDGDYQTAFYEKIYAPHITDSGDLHFLTVRDGNIFAVDASIEPESVWSAIRDKFSEWFGD